MKKIKILLLGFLAVLTVGIVSSANTPVYADEADIESLNVNGDGYLYIPTSPGEYIVNFDIDLDYMENITVEVKETGDWEVVIENGVIKNNEYSYRLSTVGPNSLKLNNYNFFKFTAIENGFTLAFDDQEPTDFGSGFKKGSLTVKTTSYEIRIFVPEEYRNSSEIIDTGNKPGVPPLVNEKGNITPVYLYSGLIVIALGIGAYVYTLGKKQKGKRK